MLIGIQTSSIEVAHILKMALSKKLFEVEILENEASNFDKYDLMFLDHQVSTESDQAEKKEVILISNTAISYSELEKNNVRGYLKTPLSLELINSLAEDLEYRYSPSPKKRAAPRFPLQLKGTIHSANENFEVEIINISYTGFKAVLKNNKKVLLNGFLNVQLAEASISAPFSVKWSSNSNEDMTFGAQLKEVNEDSSQKILEFVALQTGLYILPE